MESTRRLPLPVATAFVICNDIWRDQRTGIHLLVGPTSHVPIREFPATVRVSVYVHLTGGHGRYRMTLVLRDSDDEPVWKWNPPEVLEHDDPLLPHKVTFIDLGLDVPQRGKYTLALLADGQEFAQQAIWFGVSDKHH
jgi:hypothetical protein